MRDRNLLQRSPVAWLALGISLAAGFVACSDDDTEVSPDGGAGSITRDGSSNTGGNGNDAAADVSSKDTGTPDTSADVVVADVSQGDAAHDGGSGGAGGTGGASGGAGGTGGASGTGGAGGNSEAGVGGAGGVDAGPDVIPADANTGDSSDAQADVATEADAQSQPPPLALCEFLDSVYQNIPDDRLSTWVDAFWLGWMSPGDCRIMGTINTLNNDPPRYPISTWTQDVNNWTLFFFGCPSSTPLSSQFALVPRENWSWPYTTADLRVFGESFIAHARVALSDWDADFSPEDLVKIEARMAYLENAYEHAKVSSSDYSASTCNTTDGGDQ